MKRFWLMTVFLFIAIPALAQGPTMVFNRTDPPTNLLKNSRFGVWSNSTLAQGTTGAQSDFEYGTAEQYDNCEDDDTGDYTLVDCTLTYINDPGNGAGGSDGYYTATETAASQYVTFFCSGLTLNHDYKFSVYVKDANYSITTSDRLDCHDNGLTKTLNRTYIAAAAAWEDFSAIWRATETNNGVTLALNMGAGENIYIDEWRIIEVTPGCIAASGSACDYWTKDSTLKIFREPNGTNTKDGSYYGMRLNPTAADDYINFPGTDSTGSLSTKSYYYQQFSGEYVCLGVWGKTSTASHMRLRLYDGVTETYSSYHSGEGGFEWIEVNAKISSSPTLFNARVYASNAALGDIYISQPVLIYGDSIGQNNYIHQQNEYIYFEKSVSSHRFDGKTGWSDVTYGTHAGSDSSAVIPYKPKAIKIIMEINDSGSAAATSAAFMTFGSDVSSVIHYKCGCAGRTADEVERCIGWVGTTPTEDGDFEYQINASGANTLDTPNFEYVGVIQ